MTVNTHVTHLVKLLTYVTRRNEAIHDENVTMFHSSEQEDESLHNFVARLDDNIRCSETCYATALVFIDRITEMSSDLTLNYWTVQRLFTTSLLIANQFLDDTAERTLQFARVAGYEPLVMAAMKTDFLFRIQFRLMVSDEEVLGYSDKLQGRFSTAEFSKHKLWSGKPPVQAEKRADSRTPTSTRPPLIERTSSSKIITARKYYTAMFSRSNSKGEKTNEKMQRSQTDGESKAAKKMPGKPSRPEIFAHEIGRFNLETLVL